MEKRLATMLWGVCVCVLGLARKFLTLYTVEIFKVEQRNSKYGWKATRWEVRCNYRDGETTATCNSHTNKFHLLHIETTATTATQKGEVDKSTEQHTITYYRLLSIYSVFGFGSVHHFVLRSFHWIHRNPHSYMPQMLKTKTKSTYKKANSIAHTATATSSAHTSAYPPVSNTDNGMEHTARTQAFSRLSFAHSGRKKKEKTSMCSTLLRCYFTKRSTGFRTPLKMHLSFTSLALIAAVHFICGIYIFNINQHRCFGMGIFSPCPRRRSAPLHGARWMLQPSNKSMPQRESISIPSQKPKSRAAKMLMYAAQRRTAECGHRIPKTTQQNDFRPGRWKNARMFTIVKMRRRCFCLRFRWMYSNGIVCPPRISINRGMALASLGAIFIGE